MQTQRIRLKCLHAFVYTKLYKSVDRYVQTSTVKSCSNFVYRTSRLHRFYVLIVVEDSERNSSKI